MISVAIDMELTSKMALPVPRNMADMMTSIEMSRQ